MVKLASGRCCAIFLSFLPSFIFIVQVVSRLNLGHVLEEELYRKKSEKSLWHFLLSMKQRPDHHALRSV